MMVSPFVSSSSLTTLGHNYGSKKPPGRWNCDYAVSVEQEVYSILRKYGLKPTHPKYWGMDKRPSQLAEQTPEDTDQGGGGGKEGRGGGNMNSKPFGFYPTNWTAEHSYEEAITSGTSPFPTLNRHNASTPAAQPFQRSSISSLNPPHTANQPTYSPSTSLSNSNYNSSGGFPVHHIDDVIGPATSRPQPLRQQHPHSTKSQPSTLSPPSLNRNRGAHPAHYIVGGRGMEQGEEGQKMSPEEDESDVGSAFTVPSIPIPTRNGAPIRLDQLSWMREDEEEGKEGYFINEDNNNNNNEDDGNDTKCDQLILPHRNPTSKSSKCHYLGYFPFQPTQVEVSPPFKAKIMPDKQ